MTPTTDQGVRDRIASLEYYIKTLERKLSDNHPRYRYGASRRARIGASLKRSRVDLMALKLSQ